MRLQWKRWGGRMSKYLCGKCGHRIESEKTVKSYIQNCPACGCIYGYLRVDAPEVKA